MLQAVDHANIGFMDVYVRRADWNGLEIHTTKLVRSNIMGVLTDSWKAFGLSSILQCDFRSALLKALTLPPSTQPRTAGIVRSMAILPPTCRTQHTWSATNTVEGTCVLPQQRQLAPAKKSCRARGQMATLVTLELRKQMLGGSALHSISPRVLCRSPGQDAGF